MFTHGWKTLCEKEKMLVTTVFILGFEKKWGICPHALKKIGGFSESAGDYKVMK